MRYDLNHSRDVGTPQPVEEVMGAPEPARPKADGNGIKSDRSVRTYVPKQPKPTKVVKTIDPAKFDSYLAHIDELERTRKITRLTARKLRAALRKQLPRSNRP